MENISKYIPNSKYIDYINDNFLNPIALDIKENNYDDIIYISSPMTGLKHKEYKRRFKDINDKIEFIYKERNILIINPSILLDKQPNVIDNYRITYIDKLFFTFYLLSFCNIVIIDDRDSLWESSRGCLSELSYAMNNNINIYGYDYLLKAEKFRDYLNNN